MHARFCIASPQVQQVSLSAPNNSSERRLQVRLEPLIQNRWLAVQGRYAEVYIKTLSAGSCWVTSDGLLSTGKQVFVGEHRICLAPAFGCYERPKLSANARSRLAPSPRQALPCMHASVEGAVAASRSSIARASRVWEK